MGTNAGRGTRRWKTILAANQRAKRLPCWICHQPIDYTLHHNHRDAFTVDHAKPLSTHPHLAEDPTNLRSAHRRCNSRRGNRPPPPGLGPDPTPQW